MKVNLQTRVVSESQRILMNPLIKLRSLSNKKVIICLDHAGLELRIMTFYSRDETMIKLLSDPKEDVHQNTADELGIGRDPEGKGCNFLLQFGGMEYMLAEAITNAGVPTTLQQAQIYRKRWDALYPRVLEQRMRWLMEHKKFGNIKYFTGRSRRIEDIDWGNRSSVHKAETTLANNAVQGSGQDFIKAAIIRTDYHCINVDSEVRNRVSNIPQEHYLLLKDYAWKIEKYRRLFKLAHLEYVLQVHDELIFFCDASAAAEIGPMVADIMCWRHPFPRNPLYRYCVPLVAGGGVGYDWKQAKGKDPLIKLNGGWGLELEKAA